MYEQIKEILVDPDKKENQETVLPLSSQNEMVEETNNQVGKIESLLKLLDKPVLSDVVIKCSKKASKKKDEVRFDLNLSRKKTESIIFRNTLSMRSSNSNTKTTVFVDEISDEKNSKSTQNLNNSIEEFFNDDS